MTVQTVSPVQENTVKQNINQNKIIIAHREKIGMLSKNLKDKEKA